MTTDHRPLTTCLWHYHFHFDATARFREAGGLLSLNGQFQESGATEIGEQFLASAFSKMSQNARGFVLADADARARAYHFISKLCARDIRYDVAEAVYVNDRSANAPATCCGRRSVEFDRIVDLFAHAIPIDQFGDISGAGREYVAPVKGIRNGRAEIMLDRKMNYAAHPLALIDEAEDSVVRAYEIVIARRNKYRASVRSYARIDDGDVRCELGKIFVAAQQGESRREDIVRRDEVRDVYDLDIGVER